MRSETPSPATLRLDKWLWFARLARTRSLAARLCAEGRVSIGGRDGLKPHHAVHVGDVIVVELPHQRRRLIVRALGERRGASAERRTADAKLLYDEPTPPVALETPAPSWVSLFEDDAVFET
jgi:ribosome-associated heat shock protein Hsp15